ncbi:MAG: fasciclin domain-containing protein [Desertifilum sp.]|nr:fasciclin domain-containing protein [Oscillatoria laete-virens]MCD8485829.1 fasciclin domain-containing protein [Desertifilum sp.]MDL5052568.1 fasciclin domain-containing protein [Oscillatoria laete-virens NRMC-F 0139]
MIGFSRLPKFFLVGLLSVGSAVALAACNGDTTTTTTTDDTPTATTTTAPTDPTATGTQTAPGAGVGTQAGTGDNVVEVASAENNLSTFTQAVEAAGLTQTLATAGPYTVFAPTNQAFDALPQGTLDQLLQPENREVLTQILSYHVVPEQLPSTAISSGSVDTVEGAPLSVQVQQGTNEVLVNGARVVQADVQASNGIIHVIDQVVLPPDIQATLDAQGQQPAN